MLKMSEAELLKHITTFDGPPKDFDVRTAHDRDLRKHGLPRRPDPKTEPHLAALWEKVIAAKPRYIKAEVALDRVMMNRRRPVIEKIPKKGDFSPSGWGGVVVPVSAENYNPAEPVNSAFGEWNIPSITLLPNEPAQGNTAGFWTGIDGFGNSQVLQAGSAVTVAGSTITNWVWTEWFPLPPIQVLNFPINAGDELSVLVCATTPTHGFCSMMNKTTNQATSIGISNPSGVTSIGATAEWIVEGISNVLPHFSPVTFSNISAGTKDHSFNLSKGVVVEITGAGGANLTTASITSPTSCKVVWDKAS